MKPSTRCEWEPGAAGGGIQTAPLRSRRAAHGTTCPLNGVVPKRLTASGNNLGNKWCYPMVVPGLSIHDREHGRRQGPAEPGRILPRVAPQDGTVKLLEFPPTGSPLGFVSGEDVFDLVRARAASATACLVARIIGLCPRIMELCRREHVHVPSLPKHEEPVVDRVRVRCRHRGHPNWVPFDRLTLDSLPMDGRGIPLRHKDEVRPRRCRKMENTFHVDLTSGVRPLSVRDVLVRDGLEFVVSEHGTLPELPPRAWRPTVGTLDFLVGQRHIRRNFLPYFANGLQVVTGKGDQMHVRKDKVNGIINREVGNAGSSAGGTISPQVAAGTPWIATRPHSSRSGNRYLREAAHSDLQGYVVGQKVLVRDGLEFFVREHDPQYPRESGPTIYGVVRDFTVIAGEALLKSAMTARGVAHLEHVAGLNPQCRGQALQQVQFDTPGPVVLQVIDRGLADAHKLGQLDLGQPSFVPERLDAELYGAHGPNIRRGGLLTTTHRRSTLQ